MKKIAFYSTTLWLALHTVGYAAEPSTLIYPLWQPTPISADTLFPQQETALPQNDQQPTAKNASTLAINEQMLLDSPALLNKLLDQSVSQHDIEAIQLLLPVYERLERQWQDDILIRYAKAQVAIAQHNDQQALHDLQAILQQKPQLTAVRLQRAELLTKNAQHKAALQEFDQVLQSELPDDVQRYAQAAQHHLKQKYQWQFDVNVNYSYEGNINQAPLQQRDEQSPLFTDAVATSAKGLAYGISASKDTALNDGFVAKFSSSIYGKYYPSARNYDDVQLQLATGLGYATARHQFSVLPFVSKRFWANDRQQLGSLTPYSYSIGTTGQWQMLVSPKVRQATMLMWEQLHHQKRTHFDGQRYYAAQHWWYSPQAHRVWQASLSYDYHDLQDLSDSYHQVGVALALTQSWQNGWSVQGRVGYYQQYYHAPKPIFNRKQQDRIQQVQLAVWHKKVAWKGIQPRLTWRYVHQDSNLFLYRYQKPQLFVEMVKGF